MKAEKIIELKEHYLKQSKKERRVWVDCYKNYISWLDKTANPYLSNLFIPKSHEAVELLTAFLVGKTQNINVEPRGVNDSEKAQIMGKLLEYQWERILKARQKLLIWVKQAILFGNGWMKVGWNIEDNKDEPFIQPIGIDNIFTDYYAQNIEDAPIIHRIIKRIDDIKNDERYNSNRKKIVSIQEFEREMNDTNFGSFDNTQNTGNSTDEYTELCEYWYKDKLQTVGMTSEGWKSLRDIKNPYEDQDGNTCIPFVKLRFKNSPLPNRAYDIGAIEPTLDIQKAFNEITNQFFDNTALVNQKGWIVRKAANINKKQLVRKPGFVIEVNDINADIKSEETGDIKNSLLEMLRFLDGEFQQASMVVNLLKAIGDAGTATEAALGQQNVQTLLDMIEGNIKDAMSELGEKLVNINIQYLGKVKSIKVIDNEKEYGFMDIGSDTIKGSYDIKISADRGATEGKAVRQKQLLDFLNIINSDMAISMQYPELKTKIYKLWLDEAGFKDMDYFFEKQEGTEMMGLPQGGGIPTPSREQGLTQEGILAGANNPNLAGNITN